MQKTELIAALDADTLKAAGALIDKLEGTVKYFKIGSVLFTAAGPAAVDLVHKRGGKVFLDLKYHDIPNTVKGAVRHAAAMGVYSVSLHLSGGAEMLQACAGLEKRPKLWGITVLTSFDEYNLFRAGYRCGIAKTVRNLAALGLANGADGVVCSPLEAAALRKLHDGKLKLVTPGIRPAALGDDQKRALTPAEARAAGADFIVVGRPIIAAPDPAAAAAAIAKELK
ncbi:MAG TPA: orotidine-5'-phosphate decarboxylase [Elusimicrobia bacterium]|nr:MAG: orotidine 5'-phosphate decarboxylase [Elusimicrobia bacterium GWA2_64_40]OGR67034.1 MAG: orotidine 5'-phosphate decarboxylase [Elusimicrobia bacterium GWB2_63_16]HAN03866.1 orotidine-5'-phosphate decarboxylase [Elusimicrobiota bacterium]HAU90082.1 orotidine-5'-phosphate decarboxylase [Elusimicrobiota bacterium]